jgi:hypothetical protein
MRRVFLALLVERSQEIEPVKALEDLGAAGPTATSRGCSVTM